MNIISGNKLNLILKRCKLRFDQGLIQLDSRKYPPEKGRYVLIIEFYAPENLTGISSSDFVEEQIWILEREIRKSNLLQIITRYFEFEDVIDKRHKKSKLYIPTKEFLPVLLNLRNEDGQLIEMLHETVGLKNNAEITKLYDEFRSQKFKEKGFDKIKPKEYYDQHFGTKSSEEIKLRKRAQEILNEHGTGKGSCEAKHIYGEIIKINPENSYAYFNRGLAILDCWKYQKLDYWLFDKRPEEIKERESEAIKEAESDFRKSIELNPYFITDYEKFKREGRIL